MCENICTECTIEHCIRCNNGSMGRLCEHCNAIKDPAQREACEICRTDQMEDSGDEDGTVDIDWRCEQCEEEYTASKDKKICVCE